MAVVDDPHEDGPSPTARRILAALRECGPADQTELVEATDRSRRAVRAAVAELETRDRITVSFDLRDARRRRYELAE